MRIIYDYKIFWSQRLGGISRYFVNILKKIQNKNDIDFRIVAPFYRNIYLKNEIEKKKIVGLYLKKEIPKTSFMFKKFNEFFFKNFVHNYKPSIIHSTYYNESIDKKNTPLIITVYDLIHEKLAIENNIKILPKFKSLKLADHIISISEKTKKDLIKFYDIDDDKISVIYLGSNHAATNEVSLDNINNTKPYILYVGSREKYKNFEFFLKAYSISNKLNNDFDLLLFGGGKLSVNEKKKISEYKLDNKVFHKEGTDEELYQSYKSAKVFVFPSIQEGFGLPLVEAMANDCPVICSNIDIFKEIAGDAAEYFDPTNLESFKDKIEEVIYSNSRIKELKLLGKIKSKNYDWERCANETIKIYEKLIKNQ